MFELWALKPRRHAVGDEREKCSEDDGSKEII